MRSSYLVDFRKKLSELNNNFSHYIFVWEQFYIDNVTLLKKQKEKFTAEIYPTNSNARQFNVPLSHLDTTHQQTYSFILKSLFLIVYSEFEVYIREFYEFARKANTALPNLASKERIPDDIFEHLKIDTSALFDKEELLTFDYIRLRRNRLTHSGGQSKGDLAELIRNKGNSLQKYWEKKLFNGTFGINFQSHDTDSFSKEEVFDLINILRSLINKTDELICSTISPSGVTENLRTTFIKENSGKIKSWKNEKAQSKFKAYCMNQFALLIEKETLEKLDFVGDIA